jgi:hypothetical protein
MKARLFRRCEVSYGSRFLSVIGAPIRLDRSEIIGSVMVVEDITEAKILAGRAMNFSRLPRTNYGRR